MDAVWRLVVRPGEAADLPFLRLMLYEAAFWQPDGPRPPLAKALADPHLAAYLAGWGRRGDMAVLAISPDGEPLGAAWYRFFDATAPGYGFVDEHTPELAVAVATDARGRGVGTALLRALIAAACAEGVPALSLSVSAANPARRLYGRLGFRRRTLVGGSWLMVLPLAGGA